MHLVKFLKKVNFLSICIIMALCFLLLLNSFVFGAVTLFHVQLFVSCAMIVTSVVVSIFYHSWCSVLCLNEAILNVFNDCGQFEKDASVSVVVNVVNKESINVGNFHLVTGLPYSNPSQTFGRFFRFIFIFRVGKSLACHSPGKWCLWA